MNALTPGPSPKLGEGDSRNNLKTRLGECLMNTYTLNLDAAIDLTDEQFYKLCRNNPDLKFERTAQRELIIMPPQAEKQADAIPTSLLTWEPGTDKPN